MTTHRKRILTIASMALGATILAPREGDDDDTVMPGFEALTAKWGVTVEGLTGLARHLYGENSTERGRKRAAKEEVKALKAKVPPEGSIVLTAEQAKDWAEYEKLGKPADVSKKLTDGESAAASIKAAEAKAQTQKLAGIVKYNPEVFDKLATADGLEFEEGQKTVDGKPEPTVYVKKADGTRVEVAEYAKTNWAAFLPSLTAQSEQGTGGGGQGQGGQGHQQQQQGAQGVVVWPQQGAAGGGQGAPLSTPQQIQAARDAGKNPLMGP